MVQVDNKDVGEKLSLIRRYNMELFAVAFGAAVVFLFLRIENIQSTFQQYIKEDNKILVQAIMDNTASVKKINETNTQILEVLEEKKKLNAQIIEMLEEKKPRK